MTRERFWRAIDTGAHTLYTPTALGSRCFTPKWHHRFHLIPLAWLEWVCKKYAPEDGA